MMEMRFHRAVAVMVLLVGWTALFSVAPVQGIRFVLDGTECFQHNVETPYDKVYASFVIIKHDNPWSFNRVGVDLTVDGPHGQRYYTANKKESDKFDFVAPRKGYYKFCFLNQSPMHETIDFDVYVGHPPKIEEDLAKEEHITPIMDQLQRLEEALYSVRFEQHWLAAQTVHQGLVNAVLSRRIVYKAVLESLAMIGASLVQVYLLKLLFERKLGKASRV
ncbi:unnamed protein product [Calypogeia fissa]